MEALERQQGGPLFLLEARSTRVLLEGRARRILGWRRPEARGQRRRGGVPHPGQGPRFPTVGSPRPPLARGSGPPRPSRVRHPGWSPARRARRRPTPAVVGVDPAGERGAERSARRVPAHGDLQGQSAGGVSRSTYGGSDSSPQTKQRCSSTPHRSMIAGEGVISCTLK